ncbi:hypothetical protein ACWEN6_07905 [Sphaerisporangium sp. NPDC004334]
MYAKIVGRVEPPGQPSEFTKVGETSRNLGAEMTTIFGHTLTALARKARGTRVHGEVLNSMAVAGSL